LDVVCFAPCIAKMGEKILHNHTLNDYSALRISRNH
jgi:hypothetical protein